MKTMTRQEFIDKYGDVIVTFSSYYKYTFTFSGETPDGFCIAVTYGGNSDDIYRFEFSAETPIQICSLDPYGGSVWRDGVEIESFYDY